MLSIWAHGHLVHRRTPMHDVWPVSAGHTPQHPRVLGLPCLSLVNLDPDNALRPTFTSNGLGHPARAQHSPWNFSRIAHRSLSILYWSKTYYFVLLTLSSESPQVHQKRLFAGISYRSLDLPCLTCYYHNYRSPSLPDITCYQLPTL
jgi:hypothetical protein